MKRGEAQQTLIATNRWWRDPNDWPRSDPDLRDASRAPFEYRADVLAGLAEGGLYVLRGPRRVGKTVAVKSAIRELIDGGTEPRRIVHMPVDGLRSRDLGSLVDAADALMPNHGPRYWFFDEITGITDGWPERIKWLRDNDARFHTDTVVLTGSSASDLTAATKALAGRRGGASAPDRVLLPMGFRSFVGLVAAEPPHIPAAPLPSVADLAPRQLRALTGELVPWLDILVRTWEVYLHVGGFPKAVAEFVGQRQVPQTLRTSLLDVIHGDAFRNSRWSRLQTRDLLLRLAAGLCSPLNVQSLANDLDVSQTACKQRLDELREAFVVWPCHREVELRPKLGAQLKLYFTDPIYARLVDEATPGGGSMAPDLPQSSQQQLGLALIRACERENPGEPTGGGHVLHHRTASRKEIDFVGPSFGGLAIESKYVDGGWRRAALTLRASRWRGILATRSELDLSDDDVLAVPTAVLAWLIDG